MENNSSKVDSTIEQGLNLSKHICKVKGMGDDSSVASDHIIKLGKRIRDMVDNCLEIDVGLQKKQKTQEEIEYDKQQDEQLTKANEEHQKKMKAQKEQAAVESAKIEAERQAKLVAMRKQIEIEEQQQKKLEESKKQQDAEDQKQQQLKNHMNQQSPKKNEQP